VHQNVGGAAGTEKICEQVLPLMAFWLFKKKKKIDKTELIRERSKLLTIIVNGCSTHPAYDGDGPTLGICKICDSVREAYLTLKNLDKNI